MHERRAEPEAPPPMPSTMRSRRKPVESRRGRKVGDPGTTSGSLSAIETKSSNAKDAEDLAKDAKRNTLRASANTSASSAFSSSASLQASRQSRFNHGNKSAIGNRKSAISPSPLADDQFIQNFFYWAFLRYANSGELTYWTDILRAAYPQGQNSMKYAGREMGMTLFESAEYAARNRDNHWFVYDLYKTYLMRDPDSGGWAFWESLVPSVGRENVRHAFDECSEFAGIFATLTPNGSASSAVTSLAAARVDPFNQTGNQLQARDCEWSVGLLSLPGRAGLDLGLGLSYSSLVWTRSGPYLYFNEDNSSPSPGFRVGFATIQWPYFDAQVGRNVYVLITSSGRRVELRQVGTSNVYEAADSSYLQLINNGSTLLVRTTDGTQMTYGGFENEWRVTQIKDRNGNYLSVTYNSQSDISTITDTLGRVITFNYDGNANLLSITQSWAGATHTWATFGWGSPHTMSHGFSNVAVVGTYNGEAIPVLRQVGLDDGSYFTFEYTGAAQVNVIRRYTFDNVQRSSMTYDYAPTTDDCPRISQTRITASNWTGINGVPAEVVTQFSLPGDGPHQMVTPDGTAYKEFYAGSAGFQPAWGRGLVAQTEVWSAGVRQKWTTTAWTQDNTGVNYQTNPRVTEANVYDSSGNRRRTTIEYHPTYAVFGLPWNIVEYANDGVTAIRRTYFDYKMEAAYTDRRVIGLLYQKQVFDGAWNLFSRVIYGYDWDWNGDMFQDTPAPATQHDRTNYGPSFIYGRGNLSQMARFDITDPNNAGNTWQETKWRVNSTGSLLMVRDHLWHQTFISYGDSFSDGYNRNTFAYPTTNTDPDGHSSSMQYNYDFGATTRTQGPPPAGQSQGAIQTIAYDSAGRVDRVTTTNNGAYTRFWYGPNYIGSLASVNNVADEAYTNRVFDGAGRLTGVANNHPGSAGDYKAQLTQYDAMGRVMKQSNPAEINGSWIPSGDDAAGWIYTQQTYNWQGKPLVTTNTDGTQKYVSYGGCGCAGSEVVTITDEVGRQQKAYSDVLGRTGKTEVLNWNGSVYATTVNTYNARDQVTLIRQYQGADTSGIYQETTISYDGHGRLQTKHVPEQNAGTATMWDYNADNTVQKITDARGASATYNYNGRHQVTSITYAAPSGITPTPNVSYGYDSAGNRISMSDGLGSLTHSYDQLSRMSSETREFTGFGNYTINYQYNLAGELSSITDPFNATIDYTRDNAGRLTAVTGTPFGSVTTYASNIQYRAWGAIKHLNSGDSTTLDASFNSRLQASAFTIPGKISKTYNYYADGTLGFSSDLLDHRFDRSYSFDHLGRLKEAFSGAEARGGAPTSDRPYKQTYGYDDFSHLTERTTKVWWTADNSISDTYVNNRRVEWQYDADGRLLHNPFGVNTHDAAGHNTNVEASFSSSAALGWDGAGRQIKTAETTWDEGSQTFVTETKYYLRSSVLGGQVLTEMTDASNSRTFVYAGLAKLAWQWRSYGYEYVTWEHGDPSGASVRLVGLIGVGGPEQELDPLGADAGTHAQTSIPDEGAFVSYGSSYNAANPGMTYSVDGIRVSVDDFYARGGVRLKDPFFFLFAAAEASSRPVGYRNSGVSWGRRFEIIYDANGRVQSADWGEWDPELQWVNYGVEKAIYDSSWSRLARLLAIPQNTQGGQAVNPVKLNSCEEFAQSLADHLFNHTVKSSLLPGQLNVDDRTLARIGVIMQGQAVNNVDFSGKPYEKGKTPIDGFQPGLVSNGQDADVYHHIIFAAGGVLDTKWGHQTNGAFLLYDQMQADRGRKESETEVRDDYAGFAVGERMLIMGRLGRRANFAELTKQIANILCL